MSNQGGVEHNTAFATNAYECAHGARMLYRALLTPQYRCPKIDGNYTVSHISGAIKSESSNLRCSLRDLRFSEKTNTNKTEKMCRVLAHALRLVARSWRDPECLIITLVLPGGQILPR